MLLRFISLALRNIGRNRRRTLLSLSAIVFGIGAALLLQGMLNGLIGMLLHMLVEGRVGAVLVHKQGFEQAEDNPLRVDLPQSPEFEALLRSVPGVRAVTPRIRFDANIGTGTQAAVAMVTAIDPVRELDVCPFRWQSGHVKGLDATTPRGLVLGRAISEGLAVQPGATLMVQASTRRGPSNVLDADLAEILGVTNPVESKRFAIAPLAWAQELLGMDGRVTEYALGVDDIADADAVAARVRARLGPGYDVGSWGETLPALHDLMGLIRVVLGVVTFVLLLVVLTGIANTMLMSVFERVREVGTMLALGVTRAAVVRLFLLESAFIGLIGGAAGATLGSVIVWRLNTNGFRMRPPGAEYEQILRPWVPPSFVVFAVVLAIVGAILAAVYPAWRASKLSPVDALRSN